MTEIKLNAFGGLTGLNNFKFSDIDLNFDKKISEEELEAFKTYYGIDSLEFASMDRNEDGKILQSEFTMANVKAELQRILDECAEEILAQVPKEYREEFAADIVSFAQDFFENSGLKMSEMKAQFKTTLDAKVAELKAGIADKEFDKKLNEAVELAYPMIISLLKNEGLNEARYNEFIEKFLDLIEKDQAFKAVSLGISAEEMAERMIQKLRETDKTTLEGAIGAADEVLKGLGPVIVQSEAQMILKPAIYNILEQAINSGIVLNIKGFEIKTIAEANQFLNMYSSSGERLKEILNEIKSQLSEETYLQKIIKMIGNNTDKINALTSADMHINTDDLDLSSIPGYKENEAVTATNKTWGGDYPYEEAKNTMRKLIDENLKEKLLQEIKNKFEVQGVNFETVQDIFETVYEQSFNDTYSHYKFNYDKTLLGTRHWLTYNVADAVDNFVRIFKANWDSAIDEGITDNITIEDKTYNLDEVVNAKEPVILTIYSNSDSTAADDAKKKLEVVINSIKDTLIRMGYNSNQVSKAAEELLNKYNSIIDNINSLGSTEGVVCKTAGYVYPAMGFPGYTPTQFNLNITYIAQKFMEMLK